LISFLLAVAEKSGVNVYGDKVVAGFEMGLSPVKIKSLRAEGVHVPVWSPQHQGRQLN